MVKTTTMACKNHVCASGAAGVSGIACPLCLEAKYCSEQCRVIDWVSHVSSECPNVHQVDNIKQAAVFAPYYYEDTLSADVLAAQPVDSPIFASHLMFQHGADEQMLQRVQAPMIMAVGEEASFEQKERPPQVRGSAPDFTGDFTVMVEIGEQRISISGTIPKDLIYLSNKNNPTAQKLSGGGGLTGFFRNFSARANKATGSLIFWPAPTSVKQARKMAFVKNKKGFTVPLEGFMKVTLKTRVNGAQTAPVVVEGDYNISPARSGIRRFGKDVLKNFQNRLKTKFSGSEDGVKNMYPLVASTNGIVVVPIFQVVDGAEEAQLVDIEFMVPKERLYEGTNFPGAEILDGLDDDDSDRSYERSESSIPFSCDPRSLDEVQGLTMALERDALVGAAPHTEHLQNVAGIIRKYTRTLLDGASPDDALTMEVNTAIHTAVAALHEQYSPVGNKFTRFLRRKRNTAKKYGVEDSTRKQVEKKLEKFRTQTQFQDEFNLWLDAAKHQAESGRVGAMEMDIAEMVLTKSKRFPSIRISRIPELDELRRTAGERADGKGY